MGFPVGNPNKTLYTGRPFEGDSRCGFPRCEVTLLRGQVKRLPMSQLKIGVSCAYTIKSPVPGCYLCSISSKEGGASPAPPVTPYVTAR